MRVPIFVLRVGVRVSFRGRNPPRTATGFGACSGLGPTSVAVSVLIPVPPRPWGGGANRAPTAPPIVATVGRGGAKRAPTLPPWFRYRGDGRRTRPRTYLPFSPPWGAAPTVPQVHLGPEKAAIPFPTFPIVRDVPVHPPAHGALRCIPPGCRLGPRSLPGPPAAALVWVPCTAWNAIREIPRLPSVPPRTPGSGFSDIRGAFLGSSGTCFASEGNRGHPRPSPIRAIPRIWKGPPKNAHSQNAHARAHVLTPPCKQRHTKCTRKIVCQNKPVVRSTRGAHAEHTRRTRNPPVW